MLARHVPKRACLFPQFVGSSRRLPRELSATQLAVAGVAVLLLAFTLNCVFVPTYQGESFLGPHGC